MRWCRSGEEDGYSVWLHWLWQLCSTQDKSWSQWLDAYLSTIGPSCLCFISFLCLFAHKNYQPFLPSVSVVTAVKKPVSYPGKGSLWSMLIELHPKWPQSSPSLTLLAPTDTIYHPGASLKLAFWQHLPHHKLAAQQLNTVLVFTVYTHSCNYLQ